MGVQPKGACQLGRLLPPWVPERGSAWLARASRDHGWPASGRPGQCRHQTHNHEDHHSTEDHQRQGRVQSCSPTDAPRRVAALGALLGAGLVLPAGLRLKLHPVDVDGYSAQFDGGKAWGRLQVKGEQRLHQGQYPLPICPWPCSLASARGLPKTPPNSIRPSTSARRAKVKESVRPKGRTELCSDKHAFD